MGCGEDDPIDGAWATFRKGDYEMAYKEFTELVAAEGAAAIEGQGWSALRLDSLPLAETHFSSIAGDSLPDAYAGWVVTGWIDGDYQEVVHRSEFVLRKRPSYVFVHERSVTSEDIRLHSAFAHLYLGDVTTCNQLIIQLNPAWVVTNDQDDLLAELERLYNDFK
jgi:hypothetical protein